ncbi:metal ABC transporter solute-binding protein, Zn/Mn family [Thiolinea disciformis]|uniref:metal ABC transporter solute-binding protein, Zn/Mn family n=1 Tax=Thiolinea disciformis TaxID=125614 RepID=UPI0003640D49|nr:zinc ABC transporter substrate-binding protein [Thiolinea disciformis]
MMLSYSWHKRVLWQAFVLMLLFFTQASPASDETVLRVFTSVVPQQYFAQRVGGAFVKAEALVQPGFSPELYEPSARQIAELAQADIFVRVGMPFEEGLLPRIQSINKTMRIADARTGLNLRKLEAHQHGDDHAHAVENELDPHLWTSPRLAKQMAAQLRELFSELRPVHKAEFEKNYAAFVADLETLDKELSARFAKTGQKTFMVFHPAWGYFADDYGLVQLSIESEGKEPSAKTLATIIEQAKQAKVKTILVQPEFSQRAAEQVAKAIEGQVVAANPLAYDYLENLRQVSRLIAGEK